MPTAVERNFERLLQPYSEMLALMRLVAGIVGHSIQVTEAGPEWVRFHVPGTNDSLLFDMLRKNAASFSQFQGQFQVLQPQFPDGKPGIYLHHLSTPNLREEYLAGFWVY